MKPKRSEGDSDLGQSPSATMPKRSACRPFHVALAGVVVSAALACTPLPDIEDDDPIVNTLSPIPLDQIDAAGCDSEAAPAALCDRLRR